MLVITPGLGSSAPLSRALHAEQRAQDPVAQLDTVPPYRARRSASRSLQRIPHSQADEKGTNTQRAGLLRPRIQLKHKSRLIHVQHPRLYLYYGLGKPFIRGRAVYGMHKHPNSSTERRQLPQGSQEHSPKSLRPGFGSSSRCGSRGGSSRGLCISPCSGSGLCISPSSGGGSAGVRL